MLFHSAGKRVRTSNVVPTLAVAALLLSGAGCSLRAAAEIDRSAELLSQAAPTRANCTVLEAPPRLPRASALVEVEALRSAVAQLRDTRGDTLRGHVLLRMQHDPSGLNARRDVLEHSLTPLVADSVQKLVFAHLRELPATGRDMFFRLRVDVGEQVELQTGRSEFCPPLPRDPRVEASLYGVQGVGPRYRRGQRERIAIMRVTVHPSGYIAAGQFVRGAPQGGSLERDVLQHLRQYSFYPAQIDGIPVAATLEIPVRIPG
jgi:hypothetical protein